MTSLVNICSFGGIALGFYLPNFWVDSNEKDMQVARNQIYTSLYWQAVIFSPGILAIFLQ